jgi:hypothetical protein
MLEIGFPLMPPVVVDATKKQSFRDIGLNEKEE